jgi:hypothetical protein
MQFIDMKVESHMYSWAIVRSTIFLIISIIVGARILIFFGFNPKTIPELGKLWFSNNKIGKTD